MARIPTLSDVDIQGQRVLVRLDLNSDIRNRKLIPSERLTAPLTTLRELQKKNARIVILAHQGRPGSSDFTSLKQHATYLNKFIKVKFVNDVIGLKAIEAIATLKPKEILLLDNVRYVEDELQYQKNKPNKLVNQLAPLFQLYVNDAFSASHREHASIVGFPKKIPSVIGRTFERELKALKKLNVKNALLVLGGSKPEDNMELLEKTSNKVLASGLFGPFCLMSLGTALGKQNTIMKKELAHAAVIRKHKKKIVLPVDLAVENKGKRQDLRIEEFPINKEILDLGIETIEMYAKEIMKARVVFFKGLAGLCNTPAFSIGTEALLRAMAASKAFTIVSGGHTLTRIDKLKLDKKKFGYISMSGGALLHYLAHNTLPGIEALS